MKMKRGDYLIFWSKKIIKTGGQLGRTPYKLPTPHLRHSWIDTFLLGNRGNLMVINTVFTLQETNKGLFLAAKILRQHGKLLVVDTRGEISPFLQVIEGGLDSIPSVMSFSGSRWVGGTLSNWKKISQMVSQYGKIWRQFDNYLVENDIESARYRKMKASYPGFLEKSKERVKLRLNNKPDLIFIVNPNESRHVIQEANGLKIPVIALVDSNTDLDGIKIPIPVNYDTMFWVYHCVNSLLRLARWMQVSKNTGLPLHFSSKNGVRPDPIQQSKDSLAPSRPVPVLLKKEKEAKTEKKAKKEKEAKKDKKANRLHFTTKIKAKGGHTQ